MMLVLWRLLLLLLRGHLPSEAHRRDVLLLLGRHEGGCRGVLLLCLLVCNRVPACSGRHPILVAHGRLHRGALLWQHKRRVVPVACCRCVSWLLRLGSWVLHVLIRLVSGWSVAALMRRSSTTASCTKVAPARHLRLTWLIAFVDCWLIRLLWRVLRYAVDRTLFVWKRCFPSRPSAVATG